MVLVDDEVRPVTHGDRAVEIGELLASGGGGAAMTQLSRQILSETLSPRRRQ